MTCGCLDGGVINFKKGHTDNLSPHGMCMSMYNCNSMCVCIYIYKCSAGETCNNNPNIYSVLSQRYDGWFITGALSVVLISFFCPYHSLPLPTSPSHIMFYSIYYYYYYWLLLHSAILCSQADLLRLCCMWFWLSDCNCSLLVLRSKFLTSIWVVHLQRCLVCAWLAPHGAAAVLADILSNHSTMYQFTVSFRLKPPL